MSIKEIKKNIIPILKSYQVRRAGIFGSAAKGRMNEKSDIDILVDIERNISLIEFIQIKQLLEQKLRKKVDLVEYKAIKPSLKKKILNEEISLNLELSLARDYS